MPRLFKMVELTEGTPVQFLAVYALRWESEWGEPKYGFVEADDADIRAESVKIEAENAEPAPAEFVTVGDKSEAEPEEVTDAAEN